ncbi:hypothetical protein BD310DRAFT_242024 [Dichomitus squalens]|uniref:Uncharacterized protein n=1 Tax=Dichomitus squalens TaxID=114155 RepID=A0A4Q9PC33_9APHY|nr:hypothetical protein BD310DRAFT_242024 [Dichomitus squalens]
MEREGLGCSCRALPTMRHWSRSITGWTGFASRFPSLYCLFVPPGEHIGSTVLTRGTCAPTRTWRMTCTSSEISLPYPTTSILPSRYVLAAFPAFKSKHIAIHAHTRYTNASPSRITASAAVVKHH